ncbi:hypothetical protein MNBD_GAMMA12-209 [hydrothermal vent metagenome]|uniref:Uncharacterized protein n=1 Tax=hydrothermal vent metagenome TaxID=652676 RepID=A0A3B0YFT4_9ZZZZ
MKTTRSSYKSISLSYMVAIGFLVLFCSASFAASTKMKPYVLASTSKVAHATAIKQTQAALTKAGFSIVGNYVPYKNAHIIIVTNALLKSTALKSKQGGFGATQRISVTLVKDEVQVAYTNPSYMFNAYRMKGDISPVANSLKAALGYVKEFGSSYGMTAASLRKYHYKIFMPYFDNPILNAKFDSHNTAVTTVENNLAKKVGGVSKVFRLDLGNNQTLIGVRLTKGCGGDKLIMDRIDKKVLKSTAHLPYEILVSDKKVMALPAKFRIAISFPSLSMVGSNSFYSIMCAPGSISKALTKVVGKS